MTSAFEYVILKETKGADMEKKLGKRRRRKLLSKTPANLDFWRWTIQNEEELNQFLLRGSERQKSCIIRVLNYLKRFEPLEFRANKGETWLNKFKESFNEN